jgi:hypothetical protein
LTTSTALKRCLSMRGAGPEILVPPVEGWPEAADQGAGKGSPYRLAGNQGKLCPPEDL